MELSQIPKQGQWSDIADVTNDNFNKVNMAVVEGVEQSTKAAENATKYASAAQKNLETIQQQIAAMQTLPTTDPTIVAKIAENAAEIKALTMDNAIIKSALSTETKMSVSKASNGGLYINQNGQVLSVGSTTWKIYQYSITQNGVYVLRGTNDTGAAISVCVTTTDVYALSAGTKLTPTRSVANGETYEILIPANTGQNILIPSTANTKFSLYYAEIQKIETYEETMKRLHNKAAVSWIDDDFSGNSPDAVKAISDALGFKMNFAIIPATNYSINQLEKIREFENQGHEMLMHPIHNSWYGENFDLNISEKSLVQTKRAFDEYLISHPNCLVYPGNASNNTDVVEMVKRHCDFAINCDASYNNGYEKNPFNLSRMFINTISATLTKTHWKNKIKEGIDKGAWIIIGTHSWAFSNDTTTNDETTPSIPNLRDIISYANSLTKIRLVGEIWRERKELLNLYK